MQNSQRAIVKIIKEVCLENNILCESFSYDWIFRLSKNNKSIHIFGYHFGNNSSTSHQICSDKSSASDLLNLNQVPAVPHSLFMSPTNLKYIGTSENWSQLCGLLNRYGKIVCKPNEGTGGDDVYLVSSQFELEKATHEIYSGSGSMAVCPFYEIDNEFRIVVLDEQVKLIYRKNIPYLLGDGTSNLHQLFLTYLEESVDYQPNFNISSEDYLKILDVGQKFHLSWKHNLGQGARPEIIKNEDLIKDLSDLALRATQALNIKFASVDIIETNNKYLVLEINSGVMMDYFSQLSHSNYQISKSIYKEAILSLFSSG